MAFTPFVDTDLPSMANFNQKFLDAIQQAADDAVDEAPKIATGSYMGTGTFGEDNPNTLMFEFEPKVWGIYAYEDTPQETGPGYMYISITPVIPWGLSDFRMAVGTSNFRRFRASYNQGSVSFYTAESEGNYGGNQFNKAGCTYYYLAIG